MCDILHICTILKAFSWIQIYFDSYFTEMYSPLSDSIVSKLFSPRGKQPEQRL